MKKIGSEFIDDVVKEKTSLLRTVVLFFGFFSTVGLIIGVEYLEFSERIYYVYMLFVAVPCTLYGINASKILKIKDQKHYLFLEKRRIYKTEILEEGENE